MAPTYKSELSLYLAEVTGNRCCAGLGRTQNHSYGRVGPGLSSLAEVVVHLSTMISDEIKK